MRTKLEAAHDVRHPFNSEGNFATFVFLPIPKSALEQLQQIQEKYFTLFAGNPEICCVIPLSKDLSDSETNVGAHLSLSRNADLKAYQIESFLETISREVKQHLKPFNILIKSSPLIILECNEKISNECEVRNEPKFYGALEGDPRAVDASIRPCVEVVNSVMKSFDFETFYQPIRPHISLLRFRKSLPVWELDGAKLSLSGIPDLCLHISHISIKIGKCVLNMRLEKENTPTWTLPFVLSNQTETSKKLNGEIKSQEEEEDETDENDDTLEPFIV